MSSVMPEPPKQFISLPSSNHDIHVFSNAEDTINNKTIIKTDHTETPAKSERKLIPILKTPPTLQRSSYNHDKMAIETQFKK